MNSNTWISFLTTTIGAAAAASATDGFISGSTAQTIASAAVVAVPYLWGLFIHRDSKVVQTASLVQGVAKNPDGSTIKIADNAPPALLALAKDNTIPTVQPAAAPPFVSSTITQRR